MTEPGKPRRPSVPPGRRDRARPRTRDPRVDSVPPPAEETVSLGAQAARTPADPRTVRIAMLEAEVARLKEGRAADADAIGAMLARVADAERQKASAVALADDLGRRVQDLEQKLEEAAWTPPPTDEATAQLERANTALTKLQSELQLSRAEARALSDALARARADGEAAHDGPSIEVVAVEEDVDLPDP